MHSKFAAPLSAALCLAFPWVAGAQGVAADPGGSPATATQRLAPVVVTATRTEARAFDVPASISRVDGSDVRDGHALVNISESLGAVPGLVARDRQNYAQDVQISVRGFGARSTFGIRGVRLYVDGIPATLPDGQGQITNVELGSVERIEVLRGPFSALYGNSSGGVIQVFTAEGSGPATLGFGVSAGSDGLVRYGAQASGSTPGGFGYNVSASHFRTDGYRDHSAAERSLGNAKLTLHPDSDSKLTLIANSVALPEAQDPMGLTHAQWNANPRGVDPSALAYNTRKTVNQTQFGVIYDRRIDGANALMVMAYAGHRGTEQFQSIPMSTETSLLNPGGVILLGRGYEGLDFRWTTKTTLLDTPLTLVGGAAYDSLTERRQGFQNFIGTTLGVQGALRRNERNDVTSIDPYLQAAWQFAPQWTLNAGIRRSHVSFNSVDAFIVGPNPDDSGSVTYGATLPVVGLMFAPTNDLHLYATAGRGFETPTLNELAYRSGGATGLNFGLQPATSTSLEAGVKAQLPGLGELTAAAFRTDTAHEIVTQTNVGGRSTYQNAGATRRTGIEVGWSAIYLENLRAQVAATLLDATYRDGFLTCVTSPCATANVPIAGGNRIPGIARGTVFAALNWAPPTGWRGGVEAHYVTSVFANDANTDAAPRYAVAAASVGYVLPIGRWELGGFVRSDNLFDRRYAGSVIVNEGNARYFEPAPGRTWLVSTSAIYRF
jgi:iron complex outermembrane receptor protein